jgi:thiol-disulfide isomerase/thioredoxin
MITVRNSLFAVTLALAAGLSLTAAAAGLNVGDPAPKLQTGKFVQGDPVTEFAPDKAYLVVFWATWSKPCQAAIPRLNQIHTKFKDKGLIVIGQSCWEHDQSEVEPFIKSMGGKMTFPMALDDKQGSERGKMSDTWMSAAGQNAIPRVFLVDTTGHIAWIGLAFSLKDKTIEAVLAGTYNAKEAAAAEEKLKAQMDPIARKLQAAMKDKDWDTAMNNLDELKKVAPEDAADSLTLTRFRILVGKKDYPAAFKLIRQLGDAHKDAPTFQNDLAWMIVTDKSIEHPDLDLAHTLAQRATDGAREPADKCQSMDTLARVKFMQGSKEEAIALERKALALASDSEKDILQKSLDSYKKGELPEVK